MQPRYHFKNDGKLRIGTDGADKLEGFLEEKVT